MDKLLLC